MTGIRIGIISDTHGLLRPEVIQAFKGVTHIFHGGDIGDTSVITALEQIAPVTAVRGNVDISLWTKRFPERASMEIGSRHFYLLHDLKEMEIDPAQAGFDVVISGHSHRPHIKCKDGVVYINPGSAGPRRFSLPVAVALLEVKPNRISQEIKILI